MSGHSDEAADFSALYRETHADVLAFLLRRCPTADDAADCLAETYLAAWQKRDQLPAGTDARPWLFGVARNMMRRGREHRSRIATAAQALATELGAGSRVCPAPNIGDDDPIMVALRELPAIEQEIITMISWDGLTPREISVVLDMSPNVVRVRAHRARAKLRSVLAKSAPGSEPEVLPGLAASKRSD
jgi:RNA polymerase sigma-70 factor (ECF subfamily)